MLQTYKIQRGFSASARNYDLFSGLHRKIADKLLGQVSHEPAPKAILDVGCGTGYLTSKLKDHFPQSRIVGLDLARAMIDVARAKHDGISWVVADSGHLPFHNGAFEMLISNLAYQWAGDLERAFTEAKRVLAPGGTFVCTLFGYDTCRELFLSLDEAGAALKVVRLPQESQVQKALAAAGLIHAKIEKESLKQEFKGIQEMMLWLKSIGANNLAREGFLGPAVLTRAAAVFRAQFSSATFEVIRVYAKN